MYIYDFFCIYNFHISLLYEFFVKIKIKYRHTFTQKKKKRFDFLHSEHSLKNIFNFYLNMFCFYLNCAFIQ